jgi:serine/threonine protein kinase
MAVTHRARRNPEQGSALPQHAELDVYATRRTKSKGRVIPVDSHDASVSRHEGGRRSKAPDDMAEQRYRVIKRLEAGGMAEVYLGEAVSMEGFKKTVAIKRVLPHLAQNEAFIQMFLDEARLSARLDHANIVSVFDISKKDDTYFLVMEFVDGANLKKVVESLKKRGKRVGLGAAVLIAMESCRGLSYAHELHDENGTPLGIVHRDISPPNILLTRRGEVKLADFGLAKASTQLQTTDPGVVKGKFSYLSPEAAEGNEVDARADIFSIGIVLWELLAGKRLFLGENDYATVKLVQRANIPRLAPLNREVDEAFEEILLRALTKDPKNRFQSARELGDTLASYLFNRQLKVTNFDLANLVQLAMSDEPMQTSEGSLIEKLIQNELDESERIEAGNSQPPHGSGRPSMLEDPASWFSDADLKVGKSVAPHAKVGSDRPSGAWLEQGLDEISKVSSPGRYAAATADDSGVTDLGDQLEPEDTVPDPDEPSMNENEPTVPRTSTPRLPAVAAPAGGAQVVQAQSKGGSNKAVVITLVAMVAIAAVAILWLGMHRG